MPSTCLPSFASLVECLSHRPVLVSQLQSVQEAAAVLVSPRHSVGRCSVCVALGRESDLGVEELLHVQFPWASLAPSQLCPHSLLQLLTPSEAWRRPGLSRVKDGDPADFGHRHEFNI